MPEVKKEEVPIAKCVGSAAAGDCMNTPLSLPTSSSRGMLNRYPRRAGASKHWPGRVELRPPRGDNCIFLQTRCGAY